MWIIRWTLIVILIVVVLGFALQNQGDSVTIHFLSWESGEIPLYLALFASFAVGMLAFLLIASVSHLQVVSELKKARKESRKLQNELDKTKLDLQDAKTALRVSGGAAQTAATSETE